MLNEIIGGLFNKEKQATDAIQETLESVAQELNCKRNDFFVMVSAADDKFTPQYHICRIVHGLPQIVRKMTIKEILGGDDEEKQKT